MFPDKNCTVSRAQWASALSCCYVKNLLAMEWMNGRCWLSRSINFYAWFYKDQLTDLSTSKSQNGNWYHDRFWQGLWVMGMQVSRLISGASDFQLLCRHGVLKADCRICSLHSKQLFICEPQTAPQIWPCGWPCVHYKCKYCTALWTKRLSHVFKFKVNFFNFYILETRLYTLLKPAQFALNKW